MNQGQWWIYPLALLLPIALSFLTGNGIKRCENSVSAFYHPLREKYPGGYVRQNRVVTFIRNLLRMDTQGTIHWTVCVEHYLQIGLAFSPVLSLSLLLFRSLEAAAVWGLVFFTGIPMAVMAILLEVTMWVLAARCKRIQKTDPRYAKRNMKPWRGHHL